MSTAPPRHPQLMAPADDPEEFITSSVYYYPSLFPTRTEVLDHTFLCNGNGYAWGEDGKIHSVFAHIDPGEDFPERYAADIRKEEERYDRLGMADWYREQLRELLVIRADYQRRARTYGLIRDTEQDLTRADGYRARTVDLPWTLLGRAPEHVDPRWQVILDEVRELFAPVLLGTD